MNEERKPLQKAIYQDVIDEYQAKAGETYEEVKNSITAEYERRVRDYMPDAGIWEGDMGEKEKKNLEAFKKKYQVRGKLDKFK